tara:strand:- start:431 stop:862 length:432 start_codon:yes stop_codon:yes gene_type:complete
MNENQQPQIKINRQYIKDISFENNAMQKDIKLNKTPEFKIDVKINTKKKDENKFEVSLLFLIKASIDKKNIFIIELDYAGLFEINNMPKEQINPFLMIECPRILFPFARRIVSDISRDGGYPPINLDMIDFLKLYQSKMAQKK